MSEVRISCSHSQLNELNQYFSVREVVEFDGFRAVMKIEARRFVNDMTKCHNKTFSDASKRNVAVKGKNDVNL